MTAILFETARILAWLFGIVMMISAAAFFFQPKSDTRISTLKELHWKVFVAAMIPLLAFTIPVLNGFNMWLKLSPAHPVSAALSVHALLVLQVWLWLSVAENPMRLMRMTLAAYPAVMALVVLHRSGL